MPEEEDEKGAELWRASEHISRFCELYARAGNPRLLNLTVHQDFMLFLVATFSAGGLMRRLIEALCGAKEAQTDNEIYPRGGD